MILKNGFDPYRYNQDRVGRIDLVQFQFLDYEAKVNV